MTGSEEKGINYLIAANTKRAQLIFNAFRPIDLVIELVGLSISLILFLIFSPDNLTSAIFILLPGAITTFLVLPIPNYQNIMCILINVYRFYFVDKQQYKWKGWDAKDEFK